MKEDEKTNVEENITETSPATATEKTDTSAAEPQNTDKGKDGDMVTPRDENGAPVVEPMPRDVFFERIRTNVPDGKFDDDEQEYFRKAMELLDAAEDGNKKYKGMNEKLMRRYQEDPEEVAILMDYMEGMPLIDAIVKHKGEEALTMKEGDEGWDSYQKTVSDRKADRKHQMDLMEEIKGNMGSSMKEFDAWAEENDFDDEQKAKVWELLQGDLDNISKGKFTKEILGRYKDALNYQKDVEGAREQGKAEGKNEAIEVKRKEMKGSGLPAVDAGNVQEPEEKKDNGTAAFLGRLRRM